MTTTETVADVLAKTPTIQRGGTLAPECAYRMDGYYIHFEMTGLDIIDNILSAVACAGKAYHHTDQWGEECDPYHDRHSGASPVEWIQNAARDARDKINRIASAMSQGEPVAWCAFVPSVLGIGNVKSPWADGRPTDEYVEWINSVEGARIEYAFSGAQPAAAPKNDILKNALEHMIRGGMVQIKCVSQDEMLAPVESLGRDADIQDAIAALQEAYGFASTSPRAQEAINMALDVLQKYNPTAPPAPVVPDGYVLVPRGRTDAMDEAAMLALCGSIGGYEAGCWANAWNAALAAAPTPKPVVLDGLLERLEWVASYCDAILWEVKRSGGEKEIVYFPPKDIRSAIALLAAAPQPECKESEDAH